MSIKEKRNILDIFLSVFLAAAAILFLPSIQSCMSATLEPEPEIVHTQPEPKQYKFGFDLDNYFVETFSLGVNEFIGDVLNANEINRRQIFDMEKAAKDIFSVRKFRAGKSLSLVRADSCGPAICMIYEPDVFRYVTYDFRDSIKVNIVEKPFVEYTKTAHGVIESNLWLTMTKNGFSPALIDKLEDALAASVSFYHTQKGDEFKIIYKEKYIDGKPVSIGDVLGAYYKNEKDHYVVRYETDDYDGFYDLEGRATKKAFLKSPVRASRISSRFNRRRFHPILKRTKPHLGTDFAAPYGTPIRAVANGTIEIVSYSRGNGKYVKMRHDKTYQTQYLHMSRFAKGMRKGVRVQQGQTIGYVGSTGLATGPHVCFRFWKNGSQVDPLRQNFPPPKPMKEESLPEYFKQRDIMVAQLDRIKPAVEVGPELFVLNRE